jgi:hypothetical protein
MTWYGSADGILFDHLFTLFFFLVYVPHRHDREG